jgi:hypothetical protein
VNVALWAEIRRLAEIEKLSHRAISRRLHCSQHTVTAAIESNQPPVGKPSCRTSILDPYRDGKFGDNDTVDSSARKEPAARSSLEDPRSAGVV